MALTATANAQVKCKITVSVLTFKVDVLHVLKIPQSVTFVSSFNRSNLSYVVKSKDSKKIDDEIVEFIRRGYKGASGIIYCTSRQKCEDTAAKLQVNIFLDPLTL